MGVSQDLASENQLGLSHHGHHMHADLNPGYFKPKKNKEFPCHKSLFFGHFSSCFPCFLMSKNKEKGKKQGFLAFSWSLQGFSLQFLQKHIPTTGLQKNPCFFPLKNKEFPKQQGKEGQGGFLWVLFSPDLWIFSKRPTPPLLAPRTPLPLPQREKS